MKQANITIYTLKELIKKQGVELINPHIFAFNAHKQNINEITLNIPSRIIGFGIILITNGSATISIDFQEITLKENDAINVFPNNIVEFKHFSDDCELKGFLVDPDFLSELNLPINSREAFNILSNNYSKTISFDEKTLPHIIYQLDRLLSLNSSTQDVFFYLEMLKIHLTLLLYKLMYLNKTKTNNLINSRKEYIAIYFVKLVAQNFRNHKNVQYYADRMYISRKHLTRTIKEVFHKTPKDIINDKIVLEIKVLLTKNDLSITQIMNELNFDDLAAFSKFFKKNTQYSPTEYRKQN